MLTKKMWMLGIFTLGLLNKTWGHIDSLKFNGTTVATFDASIAGGQTFAPSQKVTVAYEVTIAHTEATTYISHSTNGTTWIQDSTFPGSTNGLGLKTFTWTVPALTSNTVKLRVYQAHIPRSNPANNNSDDYNLVSGNFSIQPKASGIGDIRRRKPVPNSYANTFFINGTQLPKIKSTAARQWPTFSKP